MFKFLKMWLQTKNLDTAAAGKAKSEVVKEPVKHLLKLLKNNPNWFEISFDSEKVGSSEYCDTHKYTYTITDKTTEYKIGICREVTFHYTPFGPDGVTSVFSMRDETGVQWATDKEIRLLYEAADKAEQSHRELEKGLEEAHNIKVCELARKKVMDIYGLGG